MDTQVMTDDWSSWLQLFATGIMAVGAALLWSVRKGSEALVARAAQQAVDAAFEKAQWPERLARELQKSRAIERQELRFTSYGGLWAKLRPLAVYEGGNFTREEAAALSDALSDWYFSESGGLMLTSQARDFYFALQDLVREVAGATSAWRAARDGRSGSEYHGEFLGLIQGEEYAGARRAMAYLAGNPLADWDVNGADHAKQWNEAIRRLPGRWDGFTEVQRFACLQQVGSKLRTALTVDLESRLR